MSRAFRERYDAIVVGGRVAGSITAALLGDSGLNVLLVERVRFPRTTISTHFFRGAGLVAVLERLSVLDEVLALDPPPLRHEWAYGFGSPGPIEEPPQDPGEAGFGLSVRRAPLDEILLHRAGSAEAVDIAQPASVRGLLTDGDRVRGASIDHLGAELQVRSRVVIGADGRHSTVARLAGPAVERFAEPMRTLYYRYVSGWRGPEGDLPDAPEFSLNGDEMAYVFPSDEGLTCVGVSAPRAAFTAFRESPDGELDRRLAGHPSLTDRLQGCPRSGRAAGGSPEPSWVRAAAGPGWMLVGDAGVHQDPWTGEGMDNAAVSAVHAAEAVVDWLAGRMTEDEAMTRYRERRDERVLGRFDECTSLAADLSVLGSG